MNIQQLYTKDVFKSKADKIIITEKLIDFNKPIAIQISNILYEKKINSVIIEGGLKTLTTFIQENIWDEARIFKSPVKFEKGVRAPIIKIKPKYGARIIDDQLSLIYNE